MKSSFIFLSKRLNACGQVILENLEKDPSNSEYYHLTTFSEILYQVSLYIKNLIQQKEANFEKLDISFTKLLKNLKPSGKAKKDCLVYDALQGFLL